MWLNLNIENKQNKNKKPQWMGLAADCMGKRKEQCSRKRKKTQLISIKTKICDATTNPTDIKKNNQGIL